MATTSIGPSSTGKSPYTLDILHQDLKPSGANCEYGENIQQKEQASSKDAKQGEEKENKEEEENEEEQKVLQGSHGGRCRGK